MHCREQHLDKGCLSGAIRAEQPEFYSGGDTKSEIGNGRDFPASKSRFVYLLKPLCLDGEIDGHLLQGYEGASTQFGKEFAGSRYLRYWNTAETAEERTRNAVGSNKFEGVCSKIGIVSFYVPILLACCFSFAAWPQTTSPISDDSSNSSSAIQPVQTTITVTEKLATETPASMVVLGQKRLEETPGVNLDDRLRQIPGFSLFRRSSSLVANPTTQGVSLRAIGSTGASRTLVLWDDVPLNDPFGGWVYWTRVNPLSIDRVELTRGANTAIFGDKAMGGAISLFSIPPQQQHIFASYLGGNENTHELSGGYSNLWGSFGGSADVRAFSTDGYFITPVTVRGSVDDRANVRFITGTLHLDYLGSADRLAVRLDTLAEERHNGTMLQGNSTSLGTLSANYTHSWQHDQFAFVGFHSREQFHSTFSAVSATRNFERLTSSQRVPAEDIGGAAYWQHHASTWNTVFGADTDDAHGTSNDLSYTTFVVNHSGGTLLQHGVFGQGDVKWGPARFYAGLRHQFTGQGDTFLSPNAGITVGLRQFRLRASGYRSFRAPTLNELYRDFRVGNALTQANANLRPERLVGVETGFDWIGKEATLQ